MPKNKVTLEEIFTEMDQWEVEAIDNRKFAEFLGFEVMESLSQSTITKEDWLISERHYGKFRTDWNWLHKVIDKIESLEDSKDKIFSIEMYRNETIVEKNTFPTGVIARGHGTTRIEATYKALLTFLNKYNEQA